MTLIEQLMQRLESLEREVLGLRMDKVCPRDREQELLSEGVREIVRGRGTSVLRRNLRMINGGDHGTGR